MNLVGLDQQEPDKPRDSVALHLDAEAARQRAWNRSAYGRLAAAAVRCADKACTLLEHRSSCRQWSGYPRRGSFSRATQRRPEQHPALGPAEALRRARRAPNGCSHHSHNFEGPSVITEAVSPRHIVLAGMILKQSSTSTL
jgi:hypothetical protein